uniref:Cuticle protein 6 n=1 Tax=Stomoxys calcitrans TaxID=35570 RepID=A0A1I8PW70_STOCA
MSHNERLVFIVRCIFFTLSLNVCHITAQNLLATNEANFGAEKNGNNHGNPVTSYYRHNIYGPNTYAFGFEVNDKATGNIQFRDEQRYANGSIKGSYGYVRPDGSVSITHFMADRERGYLSQTQNFEPGDQAKWAANWPTKKPNILMDKPPEPIQPEVKYDEEEKMNLTSILLPLEPIKAEHGIDLNPTDLEKELVNPAVLEVINGDVPLLANNKKKADEIGFSTFNELIHPNFPIIPFELPHPEAVSKEAPVAENQLKDMAQSKSNKYDEQKINNAEKILAAPNLQASPAEKYVKSKENNAEKSLPTETLKMTTAHSSEGDVRTQTKAKSLSLDSKGWDDRVIGAARQEYLQDIN